MRIAYITTYSASNVNAWSGLGLNIHRALRDSGLETRVIDNLGEAPDLMSLAKKLYFEKIRFKNYATNREPRLLKSYAEKVERILPSLACDLVFSPSSLPIAYLHTEKPIVVWTDATFAAMVGYYPGFTNLCQESIRNGNAGEQSALNRCALAIYSSDWAAASAVREYGMDPRKVKVVPFGANVEHRHERSDIARITAAKDWNVCKLLFAGVDWVRKGGDLAVAVAGLLNQRGLKTELHVVGCTPPRDFPDYVKIHGFLSKTTAPGLQALQRRFTESHFLILPTRAECFGLVIAEASSFGLPSLATNVGGVAAALTDGVNGRMFHVEEGASAYCEYIERVFSSRSEYDQLAFGSFQRYCDQLNWLVAGRRVRDYINEL